MAFAERTDLRELVGERCLALVDAMPDPLLVVDPGLRLLHANRAWLAMTGLASLVQAARALASGSLFPSAEDTRTLRKLVDRARGSNTGSGRVEMAIRRTDQETIAVSVSAGAYEDPEGGFQCLLISMRDITTRKQSEETLRASEERLKILFEYAPDGYYLCDLKGNFIDGNRAAEQIVGFKREELIGKSFLSLHLLPKSQLPKAAAALARNALGKPAGPEELILNRKDGSQVSVEIRAYPVQIQGRTLILGIARDTTERRKALKALRESEAKFRELHDSSRDGCAATDLSGRILESNRAFREMLGYSQEELTWLDYRQLTPLQWHAMEKEIVTQQVLVRGYSDLYEKEYIRKDGTVIPIELRVYLKRDSEQRPSGMWAIVRDISERKRAQEALRESEEQFRVIFDEAHEGIAYLGATGRILELNKKAAELFGGTRDEVVGKHFTELGVLHVKDIPRLVAQFPGLLKGDQQPIELWITNKQGHRLYLECAVSAIRTKGDTPGLVVMVRDATERKRAEDRIRAEKAFSDSAINSLPGIFYMFDTSGRFVRWNRNMEAVTEYSAKEMERIRPWDLFAEQERATIHERIREVFATGTSAVEAGLVSKSGVCRQYYLTGHRIEEQGQVYLIGVGIDISERKRIEQAMEALNADLARAVQDLERSNQELRDFAHVAAHDLKAPLRGIATLADWIVQDYADRLDDQGRENLGLLQDRVMRMTRLIEGILRYSEIGHGQLDVESIDAGVLVNEVIEQLAPPEYVAVSVEGRLPTVYAERTQLTQVFQNLISNAIKYLDKPEGCVRVTARDAGDRWLFRVSDNGPGIDREYFDRIFQMFQTLAKTDRCESTGLGLAVVKKIVEMHGGRVWVESEAGQGSTFCFTLPKTAERVAQADR
jgi:PAS domain S-box-containing protein